MKNRLGKQLVVKIVESGAFGLDSFRLPLVGKEQEAKVRSLYQDANRINKRFGFPEKTYKRINREGRVEEIR